MTSAHHNVEEGAIVHVRPGMGGVEGDRWAEDVHGMLIRYARRRGFTTESVTITDGNCTFVVRGESAHGVFRFEQGIHRVRRVPKTETQGRVYTSTAVVVVRPALDAAEQQAELLASRPLQLESDGPIERVRTYDFDERQVRDHRIDLTSPYVEEILLGDLREFTDALQDGETL